jgi:hypothetical protein
MGFGSFYAQEAVLAWLVAQIEVKVAAGALTAEDRHIWVMADHAEEIEAFRRREKECFWQHGAERELLCAATPDGTVERTTTALCARCGIPGKAVVCAALAWPHVRALNTRGRQPAMAVCEDGRDDVVGNGSGCWVHGANQQCWHRLVDAERSSLPATADAGERLAEEFDALDLTYRAVFRSALLGRAPIRAGLGLGMTCQTGADFVRGVAIVSDLIDKLDCRAQITAPTLRAAGNPSPLSTS